MNGTSRQNACNYIQANTVMICHRFAKHSISPWYQGLVYYIYLPNTPATCTNGKLKYAPALAWIYDNSNLLWCFKKTEVQAAFWSTVTIHAEIQDTTCALSNINAPNARSYHIDRNYAYNGGFLQVCISKLMTCTPYTCNIGSRGNKTDIYLRKACLAANLVCMGIYMESFSELTAFRSHYLYLGVRSKRLLMYYHLWIRVKSRTPF